MELILNNDTAYKHVDDINYYDNAIIVAYQKDVPKYQLLYNADLSSWYATSMLNTYILHEENTISDLCNVLQEDYYITRFEYIKLHE